jgi:hypothetical protein
MLAGIGLILTRGRLPLYTLNSLKEKEKQIHNKNINLANISAGSIKHRRLQLSHTSKLN